MWYFPEKKNEAVLRQAWCGRAGPRQYYARASWPAQLKRGSVDFGLSGGWRATKLADMRAQQASYVGPGDRLVLPSVDGATAGTGCHRPAVSPWVSNLIYGKLCGIGEGPHHVPLAGVLRGAAATV